MATIPENFLDLLTSKKAFANIATTMKDGSPQVTPIWFDYSPGIIHLNTASGRVKAQNMQEGAKVALSIMDPDNPYRYVQIRGHVAHTTKEGADRQIDAISHKYLGKGYTVLASYGHVRDLPPKDGSVRPDKDFAMSWEVEDKADKRFRDPDWQQNLFFDFTKQLYLLTTRWAEHNARFHNVIDLAGNSPRLVAILKNLRELSTLYITHSLLGVPDRARRANAEHEDILRAVFAHDPAAAADAVLRHLDGTLGALRTIHQLRTPRASTVHARVGGSSERGQLM